MRKRSPLDEIELGMYIERCVSKGKKFTRAIPVQFNEELQLIKQVVTDKFNLDDIEAKIIQRTHKERCKPHYVKIEHELKEEDDGLIYPEPWLDRSQL